MKLRVATRIVAVVLAAAVVALLLWRPWRPTPTPAFVGHGTDPAALADSARRVTVVWVNRSGRPCTATIDGNGAGGLGQWSFSLAAGEAGQRFVTHGPYTLKGVLVEAGGRQVRHEVVATLQPGTTHEVRIGPGDGVAVVAAER